MASERLPMHKALEILRLKWSLRLSNREAARSADVSPTTVVNAGSGRAIALVRSGICTRQSRRRGREPRALQGTRYPGE